MPSDERFTEEAWERATGRKYSLRAWQQETGYREFTLKGWTEFIRGQGRFAGGSAYHADAVHFDGGGGGDILTNASLSCVNGLNTSMSYWIRIANNPADGAFIWGSDVDGAGNNAGNFVDNPANRLRTIFGGGGANSLQVESNVEIALDTWYHVLISADTNHDAGQRLVRFYLNDVDVTDVFLDNGVDFSARYDGVPFDLGNCFASDGATFDIADFWFAPNQSLLTAGDISEATRRKFISATGKPVSLGSDGLLPTGVAPAIFFSGDAAGFVTNKGTGGAFALTGALTNAPTSPSD